MPARLSVLIRNARRLGCDVDKPRSGSHWRFFFLDRMYPVPAHNGPRTEIPDVYIRGLASFIGVSEAELKK